MKDKITKDVEEAFREENRSLLISKLLKRAMSLPYSWQRDIFREAVNEELKLHGLTKEQLLK